MAQRISEAAEKEQHQISDKRVTDFAARMKASKADLDEVRMGHAGVYKEFDDAGGNNKAMKAALKLAGMEATKAQEYWRDFSRYCGVLGIFDQFDLVDPLPGQVAASGKGKKKATHPPAHA